MYEAFYGFREKPFHVTADPAFLYPSRQHREALDHLLYGIRERLGFLMITGEVGTGKTTLAKALLNKLEGPVRTALVLHPTLSAVQLLAAVLRDFGAGTDPFPTRRGELLQALEGFLLEQTRTGGTGVLIVDEAQALPASTLEQVRLLSNVETAKQKLLQIVLIGQPELERRLAREPRLRALRQRVAVSYRIRALSPEEVAAYVAHRLSIAGAGEFPRFTEGATARIAAATGGIPRRINQLCDQALVAGFVRESRIIDESMVEQALGIVPSEEPQPTDHVQVNVNLGALDR